MNRNVLSGEEEIPTELFHVSHNLNKRTPDRPVISSIKVILSLTSSASIRSILPAPISSRLNFFTDRGHGKDIHFPPHLDLYLGAVVIPESAKASQSEMETILPMGGSDAEGEEIDHHHRRWRHPCCCRCRRWYNFFVASRSLVPFRPNFV